MDSVLAEDQTADVLEDEIHSLLLCKGVGEKEQGLLNAALHGVECYGKQVGVVCTTLSPEINDTERSTGGKSLPELLFRAESSRS